MGNKVSKEMELISVIVPIYNVEPYLLRCVDSIRRQTYQNLEIILVDDGSPDRCPVLCDEIASMDSRVKVIHKENEGLGFARNSGLDVATGQYVTFIDSDDWISEDHIDNLYVEARKSNADVVIGGHTSVSVNGEQRKYTGSIYHKTYNDKEVIEQIVLSLIGAEVGCPKDIKLSTSSCMNLYRMSVIKDCSLRFESERIAVAEDFLFNLDFFCCSHTVSVIKEVGYFYFENTSSISRKYDPKRFERTIRFYHVLRERISRYNLADIVENRAERTFLLKIRVALRLLVCADLLRREK